jgi:hypothetical protein
MPNTDPAAALAGTRAVLARFTDRGYDTLDDGRGWNEADVADLTGWTGRLLAAAEAVLTRHKPLEGDWGPMCAYCWTRGGSRSVWPCAEYLDLTAKLLTKEE